MRLVITKRPGKDGRQVEERDYQGGIFTPVPGGPVKVAYSFGPKLAVAKQPMFQCPVSAIPQEVYDLLMLWWELRLLRLPPPVITPLLRRAFGTFENLLRVAETNTSRAGQAESAALAAAAMVQALGRGGR